MRDGKPLQAVALITQIIKCDPTVAVAYLNRGSAQASAGEVALALGDFTVAIKLASRPGPGLVQPRHDLHPYSPLPESDCRFHRSYQAETRLALAYCNRGLANMQLGRYDEACRLRRCHRSRSQAHLLLLQSRQPVPHSRRIPKAINDLTEALSERRDDAVALTRRAQAYEALGRKRSARRFPRRARGQSEARKREGRLCRIMTEQQRSEGQK